MINFIPTPSPGPRIGFPGFYRISEQAYHADPVSEPSLSSSCALTLLNETPAHAKAAHPRLTVQPVEDGNKAMDFGSVVHEMLAGGAGRFEVADVERAPKGARAEARSRGKIFLRKDEFDTALEVFDSIALRLGYIDDLASVLELGIREPVYVWQDIGGGWCRVMTDLLHIAETRAEIVDYKTTARGLSDRECIAKISAGLDLRAAFYVRGLLHLLPHLAGRISYRWVFAEVEPPYEVRVWNATPEMLAIGDKKAAFAIELWRKCLATRLWPGYPRAVESVPMPPWYESQWLAREIKDEDIAVASRPMASQQPVEQRRDVPGPNILGAG